MSRGSATRQRIVARSVPLFNTRGFAGTSMSEVLAAAGVEKGGLYNHFRSKEELALAAFDHAVGVVEGRYREAMAGQTSARARLEALAEEFRRIHHDPPFPGGCPLLNTAVDSDDTFPELRERARRAITSLLRLVGRTVKDGMAAGEFRADADPRGVASQTVALLEGAHMLSRLLGDPAPMDRAVDTLTTLYRSLEGGPHD